MGVVKRKLSFLLAARTRRHLGVISLGVDYLDLRERKENTKCIINWYIGKRRKGLWA
jgi:hypothetical protein